MARRYLFLQGVASPFFARLADHLRSRGDQVMRVSFCVGDRLQWGLRRATAFRGASESVTGFLLPRIVAGDITDLVLFGSQRPLHQRAIRLAESLGIRVHVFEEGYVRPNWLTLERGGVNADSPLPRDPAWYLAVDPLLPQHGQGRPAPSDIRVRALHDLAFHLANGLNPLLYRGYRTHRPHSAPTEYLGWIRRFSQLSANRRHDAQQLAELHASGSPFYVLPLQLNGDTQITVHSRYGGMRQLIDTVVRGFAADAPAGTRLVIKNHPLDTGLVDYPAQIRELARELDLRDRVVYLETGLLPALLAHARGMITVNSTAGMIALGQGCPTITLGAAIYDLPGLTFQGRLRDFWSRPTAPDETLFRAFRNTVIHVSQVNGDFYTRQGMALAVGNCDRLLAEPSPLEVLCAQCPPGAATKLKETAR